jgi:REP element-mobilizing transposase RayT
MARGIERRRLFLDDEDRDDFVRRLGALATSGAFVIYAWALIPNHFHLLVRTGRTPLSRNMRSLMSGYAGHFNRRHKRHGHVFQNRFKSIVCEEDSYLLELTRYIHLNPLRAGLVKDLVELDRYGWCGHSALVGRMERPWQETSEVLGRFAEGLREARKGYGAFLLAGVGQGRRAELMGGGLLRSHGGWVGVSALRQGREGYRSDERILGSSSFVEKVLQEAQAEAKGRYASVDLPTLERRICEHFGMPARSLRGGGRSKAVSQARAVLCYTWVRYLGRSGRQLARELRVRPAGVYWACRNVEENSKVSVQTMERWCGFT